LSAGLFCRWTISLDDDDDDNGYMDGQSQIKVNTDERTQFHSAQSSLAVTYLILTGLDVT